MTQTSADVRRRMFFLASVFATLWVLLPLLEGILLGAALAFLSEPVKRKLDEVFHVRGKVHRSATIAVATVALISVVFLFPFSAVVIGALQRISASLGLLASTDATSLLDNLLNKGRELIKLLPFDVDPQQITSLLSEGVQKAISWLAQNTGRWLAELPSAVFTSMLAVISWGYFLTFGRRLRISILRFIFPWPDERALLRFTFSNLIRSLVVANIFVSLIQALIIGVFLGFTGVPHLLLWTSAAFFLSFIPVIGTAPITLGSALWCWTVAGRQDLAIAMLVCAVIAGTSDNFIRPLVARGAGDLNPFWLFLAMMGGLAQFGAAGFILGPFALAITVASGTALRMALKKNENKGQTCET